MQDQLHVHISVDRSGLGLGRGYQGFRGLFAAQFVDPVAEYTLKIAFDPGKCEPHSHRNLCGRDASHSLRFTGVAQDANTPDGAHSEPRKGVDSTAARARIATAAGRACLRTKVEHFPGHRKGKSSLRSPLGTNAISLFAKQSSGDYHRHVGPLVHLAFKATEHTSVSALSCIRDSPRAFLHGTRKGRPWCGSGDGWVGRKKLYRV
jgi:hypothetical protein